MPLSLITAAVAGPAPQLPTFADYLGPVFVALFFIAIMSRVREAVRLPLNAVLVIGASGVYMSGGFGLWEVVYAMLAGPVLGYFALRSYYVIGLGWLLHATWDILHHLYGNPIWPFMPSSSFGCLIFDTVIGAWFLAGARSPFRASAAERPATVNAGRV